MLKTRIITAVISVLVLGAVLFLIPPSAAETVIAALILVGAWEWSGFLGLRHDMARSLYVALIATLMGTMVFVLPEQTEILLKIGCGWWFVAFIWTFYFPTRIPTAVRWICGALVLVPLFVALLLLYRLDHELLVFALLIVWASDAGAYFAGTKFGRVKLAPHISPGKTWEGVIGGLTLVVLLAFAWASYSVMPLAVLLPFCLGVGALSIVGDLTVSMFKRTAGVKDSGALFPGHGGVLDRIDSIAAAAPLFALGLAWLGLA